MPVNATAETIRELVAPVVMISANGLICLALYNRLAAVVARLRVFYKERFEVYAHLAGLADEARFSEQRAALTVRLESLERQCGLITRRARWLRDALLLMLAGVIGMLLSTLLLGLSHLWPALSSIGLAPFVIGVISMIGGVGIAMRELLAAMDPLHIETETFRRLPRRPANQKTPPPNPPPNPP